MNYKLSIVKVLTDLRANVPNNFVINFTDKSNFFTFY